MSAITLTIEDPASPEALALADEFWELLGVLYGDTGPNQLDPAQVSGEGCVFLMARRDGVAVGCGAVRPLDNIPGKVGEFKRIFVTASARRQGIALMLLTRLEAEARKLGYTRLCLETGTPQFEAVALYEKMGWHPIPTYGEYADDPLSVCFGKELT